MTAMNAIQALKGQILSFNLSPKGVPEGIILQLADTMVQVNFDSEIAGQLTQIVSEGHSVVVEARRDADVHADAANPVFSLLKLSLGDDPKSVLVADGAAETDVVVTGKILRLNHARRGEVNGAILDSGEFVHLRPHGVHAVGGLAVGETIEVRGDVRPGWSGHRVIEARSANGIEIGKPPHKKHEPKHRHEAAH